jgi:hypothetical protein
LHGAALLLLLGVVGDGALLLVGRRALLLIHRFALLRVNGMILVKILFTMKLAKYEQSRVKVQQPILTQKI